MEPFSDASANPQLEPPQPDLPADWARLLPREVFAGVIVVLRAALPSPVSDDPADEARCDQAAVAALGPETAAEARLAAEFVMADAWAMDCFRQAAGDHGGSGGGRPGRVDGASRGEPDGGGAGGCAGADCGCANRAQAVEGRDERDMEIWTRIGAGDKFH